MLDLEAVNFTKDGGTVTVIAQDARSGAVLMVAGADREAVERTIATGEMHYRSRTRGLWHKGATSGNVQRVVSLALDCDGDAVLARVEPAGPACHSGAVSCFGATALGGDAIGMLARVIAERAAEMSRGQSSGEAPAASVAESVAMPARPSYTQRLLTDRNLRLKKLGEEAAELVIACSDGDRPRVTEEAADLVYHIFVAMQAAGVSIDDLRATLAVRAARPAAPSP